MLYDDENDPVEKEHLMIQEWERTITKAMFLSKWEGMESRAHE